MYIHLFLGLHQKLFCIHEISLWYCCVLLMMFNNTLVLLITNTLMIDVVVVVYQGSLRFNDYFPGRPALQSEFGLLKKKQAFSTLRLVNPSPTQPQSWLTLSPLNLKVG